MFELLPTPEINHKQMMLEDFFKNDMTWWSCFVRNNKGKV
jgi:hypothetical protein